MANNPKQFDPNDLDSIDALLDEVSQKTDDAAEIEKSSKEVVQTSENSPQDVEQPPGDLLEEPDNSTERVEETALDASQTAAETGAQTSAKNSAKDSETPLSPADKTISDKKPKMANEGFSEATDNLDKIPPSSVDSRPEAPDEQDAPVERLKEFAHQTDARPTSSSHSPTNARNAYEPVSKKTVMLFLGVISAFLMLLLVLSVWVLWAVTSAPEEQNHPDEFETIQQLLMKQAALGEANSEYLQKLDKKLDGIHFQLEQFKSKAAEGDGLSLDLMSEKQAQESEKQADTTIDSEEYRKLNAELISIKALLKAQSRRLAKVMSVNNSPPVVVGESKVQDDAVLKRLNGIERRLSQIAAEMTVIEKSVNRQAADVESYEYKGPKPPKFYEDKVMEPYQ
ncbi:hypothetical protein [Thiomicrorhabdus sp.]|uniref:hypothetical protein n=1 Tax=Thiomicrorhabdus sp. TaxID=2039724 RepID=UPI0029C7DDA5|nr:hypothetical protein [Thiomicrorhabdus sp.]